MVVNANRRCEVCGSPSSAEDVGIVDLEDGLRVGDVGPEEDVEEPLGRTDGAAVVLERLGPADHEERVARDRVERLHPPALEDREAPERLDVEAAHRARRDERHRRRPRGRARRRSTGRASGCSCCGLLLLRAAAASPARRSPRRSEMAKWTRRPSVTSTVEMYGMSQPGFCDDLQDGQGVALPEARLVERLPVVAERLVHVDEDVAVLAAGRVLQPDEAREVLRDVGARVDVVPEVLERERVGQVLAPLAQRERCRSARRTTNGCGCSMALLASQVPRLRPPASTSTTATERSICVVRGDRRERPEREPDARALRRARRSARPARRLPSCAFRW